MSATAETSLRELGERLTVHGIAVAEAFDRADVAERLRALGEQLRSEVARVLVVGEFKQGKTSLVNALVGRAVLPVDDDAATVIPVALRYADEPHAMAVIEAGEPPAAENRTGAPASVSQVIREPVPLETLRDWVVEHGVHADLRHVRLVEVALPSHTLRDGLVLIDLPGVGGLGSFTGALALAALPAAHGVIFVSDAAQELTAAEVDYLRRLAGGPAPVAVVKSRTDIHPDWRRVVAADAVTAEALAHAFVGVSSEVWSKGEASGDDALRRESAIPKLSSWLRLHVGRAAMVRRILALADGVEEVTLGFIASLEAERAVIEAPDAATSITAELAAAQHRAARLRSAAGRWQQVLVDVFTDLANDADHRLRAAIREALAAAEAHIDRVDPAATWEQDEPELRRRVAGLVAAHSEELHQRIAAAAAQVASVFTDDAATIEALVAGASAHVPAWHASDRDTPLELGEVRRRTIGGQAFVLVRSSYGGALMAGFVGGVFGLAVAPPAMLAVGVALGSKGLREENERQLTLRRSHAKAVVRRFVDDVLFEVGKDSRDTVRFAQRHVRDFFAARADELAASADAALGAARAALEADTAGRAARRGDVDAQLERLRWLIERCRGVRSALDAQGAPG